MTLTPAKVLTAPYGTGRLDPLALWPELRTRSAREDRARAYIAVGTAQASSDGFAGDRLTSAALLWTYYRAWQERYDKAIDNPTSISLTDEGGSSSWTSDQLDRMRDRATAARSEYLGLLAELEGETPAEPLPGTMALHTEFYF